MERTLSLVLDDECKISLTLMQDDAVKIDEFTSKKFENSEQIRDYFKKQIADFLEKNKNYIEAVSKNSGRKFRGRIVVLEARENNNSIEYIEKRVLYKKHLVAFKELIKDKGTMIKFLELEKIGYSERGFRKLISPFLCREIKYANYKIVSQIDFLRRELKKEKNNFYDILRIIIKAYEIERKYRKLKTIDAIYKQSKTKVEHKNSTIPSTTSSFENKNSTIPSATSSFENNNESNFYYIDGISYHEDEIPFGLEELSEMEANGTIIDRRPDGLGPNERTRQFL